MSLWIDQTEWPSPVEAGALDPPGGADAARYGARQEGPEALPHTRAGRILGSGDADVVAAVVLDEEVAVTALRQGDLAQPLLQVGALVAKLVGGVDRDPTDHAHRQCQADAVDGREATVGPEPTGEDQPGVLDGDEDVGTPAVVAVLFEPLDDAVGRVLGVHADEDVQHGEDDENQHRAVEPEDTEPGERHQAPGDETAARGTISPSSHA